ncbi:MAG: MBL fold metallo-hydrolase, partial [Deltaproteobacteria bacterium]|nr:MBL fold metallo-hydrolase [Deltaproteobacteria bacterium]
ETFPAITTIHVGKSTVYAVRDRSGVMLIDAGVPGQGGKIIQLLQKKGFSPGDIKLIVITHVHYDHVGSLAELLRSFPCPVAVHENEAALLRDGKSVLPAGTSAVARFVMGLFQSLSRSMPGLTQFDAVSPDLIIKKETFLHAYGISGRILPTPGHTVGSLSVLLDNGTAFVGDLAVNVYPWGGPIFPPVADDVPQLMKSWQALMAQPVKTIYPGHGKPFPVTRLRRTYEKRMKP